MRKLFVLCIATLLLSSLSLEPLAQYNPSFHQVFVGAKYIALMKQHILTIEKNDWGKLGGKNFDHGHLLMKPRENSLPEPLSPEKLFQESIGVLYHTDEELNRWWREEGDLPISSRRPRSLLAYWDGRVFAASLLFQKPVETTFHFSCCGTIHLDDLATERPEEFAFWRGYQIATEGSRRCYVNLIIDMYYSFLHPEMLELHGDKYAVTMGCKESSW